MMQIVAGVGQLLQALYTNSAACGRTKIANLVPGADRIDNNCIEHLLQLHR